MQPKTDKAKQKAKERYKLFKEWDQARTPIPIYKNSKKTEKMWMPAKKEYFVEIPQSVKSHNPHSNYVSDKGNVISVINGEIVKRQPTKKSKDKDYLTIFGVGLHTLVWWSFYKTLHNSKAYNHKIVKTHYDKDNDYISCGGIKGLTIEETTVHHRNKNPKNNKITNLLCTQNELHKALHGIDRGYEEERIVEHINKSNIENAVIVTDKKVADIDINSKANQQVTKALLNIIYKKGQIYFNELKKMYPDKIITVSIKFFDTYFNVDYDTSNDKLAFSLVTMINADNIIDLDNI